MSSLSSSHQKNLKQTAREVVERLRAEGHDAYWVGGCVRDMLMGREPLDYDIATGATPDEVMRLFRKTVSVGAKFGVVRVLMGEHELEVATFRSDHGILDGRHPVEVRFSKTAEEDVQRRDFTINGLLFDPIKEEVLDFVDGQKDIDAGVIRAIGVPTERFAEDRLRMLRAVRFAARFRFEIEEVTYAAVREQASSIGEISVERIRDEMLKMLTEGNARFGMELLDSTGLLLAILPEVAKFKGVEQPPQFHPEGDVWTHVLIMLEKMKQPTPTLALAVLLHDIAKPATFRRAEDRIRFDGHASLGATMAQDVCERWKLSRAITDHVVSIVRDHLKFIDVRKMRQSTLKRFIRQVGFDEHLELHRLDCLASHGGLDHYEFVRDALATMPEEVVRPPRLLTGNDLMAEGYPKGPRVGEILTALEDAQLNGEVQTAEQAHAFVAEKFPL